MRILSRRGFLTVIFAMGLASLAVADEPKPCVGRWVKGKYESGVARIHRLRSDAASANWTQARRRMEELARDAYFSAVEFAEALFAAESDEDQALAGEIPAFYYERGKVRAERGDYDAAIRDFNTWVRLAPNSVAGFFARSRIWGEKKEFYRGIRDLDRCIRLEPRTAEAYRMRGMYWLTLDNTDHALEDFDEFVRLDASARAHFCRALAWIHDSEWRRARRDLDRAIRLAPEAAIFHFMRGGVCLSMEDDESAIEAFNRALDLSPELGEVAYKGRAIAWGRKGDFVKAAEDAARAARSLEGRVPAFPGYAVRLNVKGKGTNYSYWLSWQKTVESEARPDESADYRYNDYEAEAEARNRFRRAVGMPLSPFDDPQSPLFAPQKNPAEDRSPTAASVGRGEYPGAGCNGDSHAAADSGSRGSIDPDARRRADELNELAGDLAMSRYATYRDGARAVVAAREACELTQWKNAEYLATLAAAYAECGDFESADKYQTWALETWPKGQPGRDAAERRLALYRDRQPIRPGE